MNILREGEGFLICEEALSYLCACVKKMSILLLPQVGKH